MTAISGKPQGNFTQGAGAPTKAPQNGAASGNAAITRRQPDEARDQDAVVRRARTEGQALRTIGETNRFDNVDRDRTEGQNEDRRRLSTTELLRGQ
ncbi:MAG TPA: hypothetical protein VLC93_00800, partial [Myxococcota bacterium]|nr:hypothetical protein [Myxococcota bacterium]